MLRSSGDKGLATRLPREIHWRTAQVAGSPSLSRVTGDAIYVVPCPERQRATLAQQRKAALLKFRLAIMSKRIRQMVADYNPILDECSNLTPSEKKQLVLARQLVQAYQSNDDKAIITAWTSIQHSPYQKSFVLTESEMQRITLAQTKNMK